MNKLFNNTLYQGPKMPEDINDALSINDAFFETRVARNTIASWIDQNLLDEFRISGHPFVSKKQLLRLNQFRLANKMSWKERWLSEEKNKKDE